MLNATDRELAQVFGRPLWRGAIALLLLAVLATAALGGFRQVPAGRASTLPMGAPGATVDTGLFAISAGDAWIAHTLPGRTYPTPGTHYLVVSLTVTHQGEADFGGAGMLRQDLVWVRDGDGEPVSPETLLRADDGGFHVSLPPRLPMPVLAVWKHPEGAPVPGSVRIGALGRSFVPRTPLTTASAWAPGGPAGQWRLPVGAGPAPGAGIPAR